MEEHQRRAGKVFAIARKMEKNKLAAARIRCRFLQEQVEAYLEDGSAVALVWAKQDLDEMRYLITHAKYDKIDDVINPHHITDADIEAARNHPIEMLVDFNVRGKAMAWCHEDTVPSLSHWKKGNKARCFVCNQMFDSIGVLTGRDGMSFPDAVRELR